MNTFESVRRFVEQCLNYASMPVNYGLRPGEHIRLFEAQAYGVVQFTCQEVWKENPELEAKLIQVWNDEWHPLFIQLYMES